MFASARAIAQRLYPVAYETGRLVRVVVAGVSATVVARLLPDMPPLAGFLARGGTTVVVYLGLLWTSGFFRPTERAFARELMARLRQRRSPATKPSPIDAS